MSYTNGLDNPELYFQAKLYTGTGSSQSITFDGSENMQPDWIWIKSRSNAHGHNVADSVRGISNGGTKILVPNSTQAEETNSSGQGIQTADSDGFTLGSETNTSGSTNGSSKTYVSWNWKAGGSASSNSNGTITSSVSANTTAGFSIVSYTGNGTTNATVGHGLGVTPNVIWFKRRDSSNNWINYFSELGTGHYLTLNTNGAKDSASGAWCTPGSSTFQLNQVFSAMNTNTATYIAYCFAEKKGYSKFSSFVGNGSSDGSYIFLGFRPAWVMIKRTDGTNSWVIYDNKREGYNVDNDALQANGNNAEGTSDDIDLLSNGFKMRTSGVGENGSGNSYIYMAFAHSPFTNSNGAPNNAR